MKRLCVLLLCMGLLAGNVLARLRERPNQVTSPSAVLATTTIYGLTTTNRIVSFAPNAPQTLLTNVQITGLQAGETAIGIDFRPATEELYLVGSTNRLYVLDPDTGIATSVGVIPTALVGTEYGVDFNPVVDMLRVVSDSEQNLRINPNSLATVTDGTLAYAAGDTHFGANPNIAGAAYSNNFPGAPATTLFDIDSDLDILVVQNPANSGTLTTVGPLGVDTSALVGFDIQTTTNTAYAALNLEGEFISRLYTIDLSLGTAALIGPVGGLATLRSIAVTIGIKRGLDTVGVYDPTTGAFFLRNTNTPGPADLVFSYGPGGSVVPVVGDFDGDGVDTIGVYDQATSTFFLRNSNSAGAADLVFSFGAGGIGYIPLVGDWNGDGVDSIGIYNPATAFFFLRNQNSSGPANLSFSFGPANQGFVPLRGDWNGDGIDTIGIYSPTTGVTFLKNVNAAGNADVVFTYGPGSGFPAVTGDYDNSGTDTIGVYDPSSAAFFLKNTNANGGADIVFTYGPQGETPLVGDWNGQ